MSRPEVTPKWERSPQPLGPAVSLEYKHCFLSPQVHRLIYLPHKLIYFLPPFQRDRCPLCRARRKPIRVAPCWLRGPHPVGGLVLHCLQSLIVPPPWKSPWPGWQWVPHPKLNTVSPPRTRGPTTQFTRQTLNREPAESNVRGVRQESPFHCYTSHRNVLISRLAPPRGQLRGWPVGSPPGRLYPEICFSEHLFGAMSV